MPTGNLGREEFHSVISERVAKERPCRTLFIRNVKFGTPAPTLLEPFERIGDIKNVFDMLDKRSMVFLT